MTRQVMSTGQLSAGKMRTAAWSRAGNNVILEMRRSVHPARYYRFGTTGSRSGSIRPGTSEEISLTTSPDRWWGSKLN